MARRMEAQASGGRWTMMPRRPGSSCWTVRVMRWAEGRCGMKMDEDEGSTMGMPPRLSRRDVVQLVRVGSGQWREIRKSHRVKDPCVDAWWRFTASHGGLRDVWIWDWRAKVRAPRSREVDNDDGAMNESSRVDGSGVVSEISCRPTVMVGRGTTA
jgi:hypothetical protein